jgi:hypothetical protein
VDSIIGTARAQPEPVVSATVVSPRLSFFECVERVDRAEFIRARDSLTPDLLAFIDRFTLEQYDRSNVRLFLSAPSSAGFGILGEELISVFALGRARSGVALVECAVAQGARWLTCLDADGRLSRLYGACGFRVTDRAPFRDDLAPAGWNYERFGRPDYVRMELACR